MGHIEHFFHMGGSFIYGVLGLAVVGLVVALGLTIAACLRKRVPAAIWLALPAATVTLGAAGRVMGDRMALEALPRLAPGGRDALLFGGLSLNTYIEVSAWNLTATLLFVMAVGLAVGQAVGWRGNTRWSVGRMVLPGVICWLGAGAAAAVIVLDGGPTGPLVYGIPAVLFFGAFPVALVAGRSGGGEGDSRLLAATRIAVGASLVLGVISTAMAAHRSGAIQALKGLSAYSKQQMTALLEGGIGASEDALTVGAVATCCALFVLVVLSSAKVSDLLHTRSVVGATLVAVLLAIPAAAVLVADRGARRAADSSYLLRANQDARDFPDLPLPEEELEGRHLLDYDVLLAASGGDWHEIQDGPVAEADVPAGYDGRLSLEEGSVAALLVTGSTPGREMVRTLRIDPLPGGTVPRIKIVTRSPGGAVSGEHPWIQAARLGAQDLFWLPIPEDGRSWPLTLSTGPAGVRGSQVDENTVAVEDALFVRQGDPPGEDIALDDPGARTPRDGTERIWALATDLRGPRELTSGSGLGAELQEFVRQGDWRMVVLVPGEGWTAQDLVHLCHWSTSVVGAHDDGYTMDLRDGRLPGIVCAVGDSLPDDEPTLDLLWGELRPKREEEIPARERRDRSRGETETRSRDRERSDVKAGMGGSMSVTFGEVSDLAAVKKYVARKKGQLQACYERELKADSSLAGKVEVVWTVNPDGGVSGVMVDVNTTGNQALAKCVQTRIRRWQFPEGEDEFEITYPLVFSAR